MAMVYVGVIPAGDPTITWNECWGREVLGRGTLGSTIEVGRPHGWNESAWPSGDSGLVGGPSATRVAAAQTVLRRLPRLLEAAWSLHSYPLWFLSAKDSKLVGSRGAVRRNPVFP